MGETKWTVEQKRAIDTRKCNLLVAAAAGSGKTAVLVERIVKIITDKENPVDIDKLLVVTFTNAAAAEMRERIADAISKALDDNPNSKNIQRQLTLLNRANITTMHSFCLDVIKNNFHRIDLDPSFRIADQTECILFKAEVMDELFEEMYDNDDEEFTRLVEIFSNYKNDDDLKEIILNIYNFVMSGPWPEKWLSENAETFNINSIEELNKTKWIKVLNESIRLELLGYIKMFEKSIDIINSTDGLEGYLENFESELFSIKNAYDNTNSGIEELYNSLCRISFGRLKTIKKDKVSDQNAQDIVKNIRDEVKKKITKLIDSIFTVTPIEMVENINACYSYIKKLTQMVLRFHVKFSEKKKEKNVLDFNDLEHLCLKILSDKDESGSIIPSEVAMNFKEYFEEVLVDEYQDSNNVQETIIGLVSRRDDENPNVFMVGDVKQSIYRFRQAKPELFIEKYIGYSQSGLNTKIQLYKNFRSRKEILDGVNYIFKKIMSESVGELEYTDEESLNLGANYENVSDDAHEVLGGPIEIDIIDRSEQENEGNDDDSDLSDEEDIENVNLEGKLIARRIKELLSSNNKEFRVLDKESGVYRKIKYKDIVILLRATKNWAENILDELGKEGIPAYSDTGTGYFESIEIRTIMSLLKVIDNPMQDVPIIALLKSPIMSFSVEELSDIRLYEKDNYLYENISKISSESSESKYSEEFIEKCKNFLCKLDEWREKSIYMAIDEFIWYLYMDTSYYGYVGAMPNGVLRQANLKILFERAKQFEQTSFKGLFNFINFVNKLTKSSGDMGSAKILGENEDVVRIMSIHKSKGLEFPVVFLCGTGKQFNLMDLNKKILYHDELGIGPDFVDLKRRFSISTVAKESIRKKMKLETLSEEIRILYVALTRAKEKLIITGLVRDAQKYIEKCISSASLNKEVIIPAEVLKAKTYLEWIGMALCQHNDGEVLRRKISVTNDISKDDDSKWIINVVNKKELYKGKDDEDINDEDAEEKNIISLFHNDKDIFNEVDRRLSYKYPFKKSTTLKSNISVSELKIKDLKKKDSSDSLVSDGENKKNIVTPKFLQEEKGLNAAEKGTAMHFVMKKINLNKVSSINDIKQEVKDLYDKEFLTEKEMDSINLYKIKSFFNSEIGKIMVDLYQKGELIYREVPFYTEISSLDVDSNLEDKYRHEKVRLQGIIDCFFEYNGELILVDYKTDYIEKGKEQEFKEKYRTQLYYYSEALLKMTNKPVKKKYLYSFYLEKMIEI